MPNLQEKILIQRLIKTNCIQQTHRENLVSVLSSKTRFKFSVYCVLVGTFLYIHRTSVCSSKNGRNKTYSR